MNVRLALPLGFGLLAALIMLFAGSGSTPALATHPPRPTPTVAPGEPPVESQQSSAAPDLVVKAIEIVPNPARVDRQVRVQVTLANLGGDVPSGNNYFVDLYLDLATPPEHHQPGIHTWALQSFYVPSGKEYTLTYTTVFSNTGSHTVYAQVDTDGNVVESNEANNIFGPKSFEVTTSRRIRVDTHEEFQEGFSNLDLSSPYGVITRTRNFREPDDQPGIYHPDYRMNPASYVPLTGTVPISDRANQVRPKLAGGPGDTVFAVWEDGRNGQVYNRDIYFARSTDRGRTWSEAVRVNQDSPTATANQTFPVIAYDEPRNRLYVLWQDNRRGNYDIWLAYSDDNGVTWHEPPGLPVNDLETNPSADQTRPAAVVDENGVLYVAWQDRRNGNDDIYFTHSTDLGVTFSRSVFVTDDPRITEQAQTAPSIAVLSEGQVAIVWQDARNISGGDPADIWYAVGTPDLSLPPYTFEIDRRVNLDDTTAPQYTPVIAAYPILKEESYEVEVIVPDTGPVPVSCRITFESNAIHFAWEDWRNGNADVFYGWSYSPFTQIDVEATSIPPGVDPAQAEAECNQNAPPPPEEGDYEVENNVMLSNRTFEVDDRCLAPDAPPRRDMEPSVQWQPSIAVNDEMGPFVAFSDGKNHDELNFDIYVLAPRRNDLNSLNFDDVIYGDVVNDNVHRQAYLDDEATYQANLPAAAWQEFPSVVATSNGVYVAWDDNRNDDPTLGALNNRDVFMTEYIGGLSPRPDPFAARSGVYISRVFDLGEPVTWYDIEWWGFTDYNADLTLQTRFGNSLDAPESNAAENGWTQWTGVGGTGGRYDAPGQNIRGPDGSIFPRYRYIQFRVNVNVPAGAGGLCVSEITLNYESDVIRTYLPAVTSGTTTSGNAREPNDRYYAEYQWDMQSINAPSAWARSLGDGRTVAVLDSGIDSGHPEFAGQLVAGYDFVGDDSSYEDDNGHGTHVAGIVAAKSNNALGISGVAWNAKIRPVKVLNASGVGNTADVADAIRWSADRGDRIINLSLGSTGNSTALRDAIDYAYNKGALVVAAAGNRAQDGNPVIYPAAYDHVLAVGSVTADRQRASYSSFGPYVDIAAPGGSGGGTGTGAWIWSTYPRSMEGNPATGYMGVAGTSQAAPHVSGVAALVWARNPGLSSDQVANILQASATDLGPAGRDDQFGSGLLNAGGAVNQAAAVSAAAAERAVVPAAAPQPTTVDAPFVPGELIVGLSSDIAVAAAAQSLADEFRLSIRRQIAPESYVVTVAPGEELRLARELAADPRVRYAEPNYLVFSQ